MIEPAQLTVVIPTRDRWSVLMRTLDGLAAQTAPGFHTVVVIDGEDQAPPSALRERPGVRWLCQPHAGPGVARNHGAAQAEGTLLLFLGDDMVPDRELVAWHLAAHEAHPAPEVAVLGRVRPHPEVAHDRLTRWLEWSSAQFDYRKLDREAHAGREEAGFGRFYSCNVSLDRSRFEAVGGFDPRFRFDYEDLDLGYRLAERGMRLRYEPRALAWHLHRHTEESLAARYRSRAIGERAMAAKHTWFRPWFHERLSGHAAAPPALALWPHVVDLVPPRLGSLRAAAERRADHVMQQRLARPFLAAWEGERDHEELRAYLGPRYEHGRLVHHRQTVEQEAAATRDEAQFYRTSEAYLYDLTAFAMSGTKDPYRRVLLDLVGPGAHVLDVGCGIGADGLRLIEAGLRVTFTDFENPSLRYLRWRLGRRGLQGDVVDLDQGLPPGPFAAAYAFDVIEHVEDPFAFLGAMEARAELVLVNLLEPQAGETVLHRRLPISRLLLRAARRGIVRYRRFGGGRSHLVAYRGERATSGGAPRALRSAARLARGGLSRGW